MNINGLERRKVDSMLAKLCVTVDQNKERRGWMMHDGRKAVVFSYTPEHGHRSELSLGASQKLRRQSMLPRAEFERLYECPMKRSEYIALLQSRGLLAADESGE